MKEMLVRIGSKPKCFGVSDLTQRFYQMPLRENSRAPTAFICLGASTCGLFPTANFFQKSMSYFVFREPLYPICEVYIDDLDLWPTCDDNFVQNVCTILQKCREKM